MTVVSTLTPQQLDQAFDLLMGGTRLEHIANLFGYSKRTFRRQLEKDQRYKDRPFKRMAARPLTDEQLTHAFELLSDGMRIEQIAKLFNCERRNLARKLEQDPRYKNYPFRRSISDSNFYLKELLEDSEIALATAESYAGDRVNSKFYCVIALHQKYPEHRLISIGRALRLIRPHSCYYDAKKFQKTSQFNPEILESVSSAIGYRFNPSSNMQTIAVDQNGIKNRHKYTKSEDGRSVVIQIPVSKACGIEFLPISLPYVSILREDYPFA